MSGLYSARHPLTISSLGQALRELRAAAGELLRVTAAKTDMDPSLLSKIEHGQRLPTIEQTARLARHYGVPEVKLQAARMQEEFLKNYAANPEAASLAAARIAETAGKYHASKMSTVGNKPRKPVNKRGKKG